MPIENEPITAEKIRRNKLVAVLGQCLDFDHLLEHCEALATAIGAKRIIGGVNTGRSAAYQLMQKRGYRADLIGIAMHRPSQAGYNCPNIFVIEDCR